MHLVGLLSSYFAHDARSQETKECSSFTQPPVLIWKRSCNETQKLTFIPMNSYINVNVYRIRTKCNLLLQTPTPEAYSLPLCYPVWFNREIKTLRESADCAEGRWKDGKPIFSETLVPALKTTRRLTAIFTAVRTWCAIKSRRCTYLWREPSDLLCTSLYSSFYLVLQVTKVSLLLLAF